MDKLRKTYTKYQSQVNAPNPKFISSQKALKLSKLADTQLQKMRIQNNYANYDQATFYKQKYARLSQVAAKLQTEKISQPIYHKQVRQLVQQKYLPNMSNPVPYQVPAQNNTLNLGYTSDINRKSASKSPLKQFFDQQQIKNSKIINISKLVTQKQTPLKYGLRAVSRSKSPIVPSLNEQQLRHLQMENRRLRDLLQNEKNNTNQDTQRLRDLKNRIKQLDDQNNKLRSQISKSQRSDFIIEQEYDPYNLKVRQNNINKIHNKNYYMSERMSQFGGYSQDFNVQKRSAKVYYDNQGAYNSSQVIKRSTPNKRSNNYMDQVDMINASQSSIQTQFLNLQNQELYDQNKHNLCRQKIAFFKKSMVLVKHPQFDIAYKRSDFNLQMDRLRLILYINNKTNRRETCTIQYDYDRQDFQLFVKKSLTSVQPRSQGRQEIQITLRNSADLGSIIYAKVLFGDKMKRIVVPAMFIDFNTDYKYKFQNNGYLQRNLSQPLVIKPMSQFESFDRASHVLDLARQYEQKYEVGKLYGQSKYSKGIVKLTWKRNKLKIQTCQQWRILMGYLFLNAEQTPE